MGLRGPCWAAHPAWSMEATATALHFYWWHFSTYSLVLGECFHLLEGETEASRDVLTGPTLPRLVREPGLEPGPLPILPGPLSLGDM